MALVEYLRAVTKTIPLLDGSLLLKDPIFTTTGDIVPSIRKALEGSYAGRHRTLIVLIDFLTNIYLAESSVLFSIFWRFIFGVSSISNHRESLFHVFEVLLNHSSDIFSTAVLVPSAYLTDNEIDTLIERANCSRKSDNPETSSSVPQIGNSSIGFDSQSLSSPHPIVEGIVEITCDIRLIKGGRRDQT
jgi:hypothetical protein